MRRGWTDGQRYITKYGKIPVVLGSEPPTPTPTGPEGRDERNQLAFCRSRRSLSLTLLGQIDAFMLDSRSQSVGRGTISSVEWGRFGMDSGVQRREERERRARERGGGQRRTDGAEVRTAETQKACRQRRTSRKKAHQREENSPS